MAKLGCRDIRGKQLQMNKNQMVSTSKFEYENNVASNHLGKQQYRDHLTALTELISNSFDSGATKVEIFIDREGPEGAEVVKSVSVSDNGSGISESVYNDRFLRVGKPNQDPLKFGRKGIGRFAVFKIGNLSEWATTSKDEVGGTELQFRIGEDSKDFECTRTILDKAPKTGTVVKIFNVDTILNKYSDDDFEAAIVSRFLLFLSLQTHKIVSINGKAIDLQKYFLKDSSVSSSVEIDGTNYEVEITFFKVSGPKKMLSGLNGNVFYCAKQKAIEAETVTGDSAKDYVAFVNCDYLESLVTTGRESITAMDKGFLKIQELTKESVRKFQESKTDSSNLLFLDKLRNYPFYPYSKTENDPVERVNQTVFDSLLLSLHKKINLMSLQEKYIRVLVRLIDRLNRTGDLLDVIDDIVDLSDSSVTELKQLLEKTTFEAFIKLGSEVTDRVSFLALLRELAYGAKAPLVAERTQLQKILELNYWLFGEHYRLFTADKAFSTIIAKLRMEAGITEKRIAKKGETLIPDFFLSAQTEGLNGPQRKYLLVEIKAPTVSLGADELAQIDKYAEVLRNCNELPTSREIDLVLISSHVSDLVKRKQNQTGQPFGLIETTQGLRIWAFAWSDIISERENEMRLIREYVNAKTLKLSSEEFAAEKFGVLKSLFADSETKRENA
jgi:hypothetical protein